MKKDLTELVFLLDRSGSMSGLEDDTVGGFNSLIEKQKKEDGECLVSVVLFDHETNVLYDRVPLSDVRKMTRDDYMTRGNTALIDAIGGSVHHIGNVHKYIRKEDVPEHTMFVITTDGMENSSRCYTSDEVKKMVEEKKKHGWEFLFIGANIDAVETAKHFGIDENRAVDYHADHQGTAVVFDAVAESVASVRCARPLQDNWSDRIRKDYRSRTR